MAASNFSLSRFFFFYLKMCCQCPKHSFYFSTPVSFWFFFVFTLRDNEIKYLRKEEFISHNNYDIVLTERNDEWLWNGYFSSYKQLKARFILFFIFLIKLFRCDLIIWCSIMFCLFQNAYNGQSFVFVWMLLQLLFLWKLLLRTCLKFQKKKKENLQIQH